MSTTDIYNYIQVNEHTITGGQPTADQLRSAAVEGVATIINLATIHSDSPLQDESGLVRSLGMNYYHIPVEWGEPKDSDFAAFEDVMAQIPAGKTLIHCAANFRVTAFYSLYAQKHLGWSEAQAEEFRAAIWKGSDYPVWEEFIGRIRNESQRGLKPLLRTCKPYGLHVQPRRGFHELSQGFSPRHFQVKQRNRPGEKLGGFKNVTRGGDDLAGSMKARCAMRATCGGEGGI